MIKTTRRDQGAGQEIEGRPARHQSIARGAADEAGGNLRIQRPHWDAPGAVSSVFAMPILLEQLHLTAGGMQHLADLTRARSHELDVQHLVQAEQAISRITESLDAIVDTLAANVSHTSLLAQ